MARLVCRLLGDSLALSLLLLLLRQLLGLRLMLTRQFLLARLVRRLAGDALVLIEPGERATAESESHV